MDDQSEPSVDLADVFRDSIRPTVETLLDLALQLWWLLLIVAAVQLGRLLLFIRRQRRLTRSGIREVDAMDGPTFERYLATLFQRLGYRVEVVGSAGGDYGGDLVIRKNGTRTIVQAKCYRKTVGIKAVQEAHTARAMYDCADAMVVTNSVFSRQAQKTARNTGVQLWGREELVARLLKARGSQALPAQIDQPQIAASVTGSVRSDPMDPQACAKCGEIVSEKVRPFCVADPVRFGGLVYCFRHQRAFRRSPPSSSSAY